MTEQNHYDKSLPNVEIAISVRNLSKEFKIYQEKNGTNNNTDSSYPRGLSALFGKKRYEKIQVLKDISFDVMKGEMVGILGRNGAGKSTLLKIISGIIEPTSGTVKVNGKMTALLGLQPGLNKNLTARENIVQYGLVLGLSKEEILERIDEVLEFAELERFADVQVSHFSSGMNARLGFSTSLLVNPDILLLDEVLAVGDYYFHRKSIEVFENIRKKKGTIILVSHSLGSIKQYCDRVILLHNGKIELIDEPGPVIRRYKDLGLNNEGTPETMLEKQDIEDEDSLTTVNDEASYSELPSAETKDTDIATIEKRTAKVRAHVAPTSFLSDDSPFLAGMSKVRIKRLRWRAKVLIENIEFAFKGKSVLDLRCQNGEFMYAAIQAGAKYAEGIEKKQELIEVARENLQYYQDITADKYKIHQGNMLAVLRKIKPGTFDTILCIGVINRLINHAGLLQQIARIKPSYFIIDANVSDSSEAIVELDVDKNSDAESSDGESGRSAEGKSIGLPSKAAVELLLRTYNFKFEYLDWSKVGIENWAGMEDYLSKRRISIIATL